MKKRKDLKENSLLRKQHNESVKNYARTDSGIILIGLLVIIIVLLILARVGSSFIYDGDKIFDKTVEQIAEKNNIMHEIDLGIEDDRTEEMSVRQIVEEIELAIADVKVNYYEDKFIENTLGEKNFTEYAKEKLTVGVVRSRWRIKLEGNTKITFTDIKTNTLIAEGIFDDYTQSITIEEYVINVY